MPAYSGQCTTPISGHQDPSHQESDWSIQKSWRVCPEQISPDKHKGGVQIFSSVQSWWSRHYRKNLNKFLDWGKWPELSSSPLDGFALSVLALFLTYVLQTFLTTSASMRRRGNQEDLFFREFGCLNSASEHDFDQCLQRSDLIKTSFHYNPNWPNGSIVKPCCIVLIEPQDYNTVCPGLPASLPRERSRYWRLRRGEEMV